jgi:2-(1,2-epoxy-1,2-dihydrophenyl)acetyl-CoA isomerase
MIQALVERAYAALATGDRDTLLALLTADFEAEAAAGMPGGIGGAIRGPEAMIAFWWALGASYSVRPEPEEWIACADGRLLVTGTYRGRERATGHVVEAAFDHLWTAREDRLAALRQLTDTALWTA